MQAIEQLDADKPKDQATLVRLACKDDDQSVRYAAVSKIHDIELLWALDGEHDFDRPLFLTQIATILRNTNTATCLIERVYAESDASLKIVIVAHCHDDAFRRTKVLEQSNDVTTLLAILAVTQFAKTRLQIAEIITDEASLEQAKALIQNKDKAAARVVKQKLSALKHQQSELLAQQQLRAEVLNDIKSLADKASAFNDMSLNALVGEHLTWRQDQSSKWKTLQHRWQGLQNHILDNQHDEDLETYAHLSEIIIQAETRLSDITQAEKSYPLIQQNLQTLMRSIDTLEQLGNTEGLRNGLHDIETRWQQCAQYLMPEQSELLRFNQNLEQAGLLLDYLDCVQNELDTGVIDSIVLNGSDDAVMPDIDDVQLEQIVAWLILQLKQTPTPSQIDQSLVTRLRAYQQLSKAKHQQFDQTLDSFHKQINSLIASLKSKDLSASSGKFRRLNQAVQHFLNSLKLTNVDELSSEQAAIDNDMATNTDELQQAFDVLVQLPHSKAKQLSALSDRINGVRSDLHELNDWKSFATEPQCLALCDAMDELVAKRNNVSAQQQADAIRQLLDKWKSLGSSYATDTHWPRFKAAMDIANEPCAVYFAQLKETKSQNLEQLKKTVVLMHNLVDDLAGNEQVDCGVFLKRIHDLDAQWKQHQQVERSKGQQQWLKFKTHRDQAYDLLEPYFADNLSRKDALVTRAETLLQQVTDNGINEGTLDNLKHLQGAWKTIGVAQRKADSKVWREFKSHCDGVYEHIKQSRSELKAADQALIQQYTACIDAIRMLSTSATLTSELERDFAQHQAEYVALPALPESVTERQLKQLDSQYRSACNAIDACRERLIEAHHADEMNKFIAKAALANKLLGLNQESDRQLIVDEWDAITLLEQTLKVSAKQLFQVVSNSKSIDMKQVELDKRLLCIRAEITSASQTPEADKLLRTEYQLQQMQQTGLGGQAGDSNNKTALQVAWYSLPNLPESLEATLKSRLDDSLNKISS